MNQNGSAKPQLPKRLRKQGRGYLPKRQLRPIRLDRVHPSDLLHLGGQFFCEDCSHFNSEKRACTLGYRAQHTRIEQMALYNLSGKIAFCRSLEID